MQTMARVIQYWKICGDKSSVPMILLLLKENNSKGMRLIDG